VSIDETVDGGDMRRAGRAIAGTCAALLFTCTLAARPVQKRALLIGIDDYSASHWKSVLSAGVTERDWSNLDGAVNDARLMRDLLVALRGFGAADVMVLTDQQATRAAILSAIESHLVEPARPGDILLFFYSGHGSQVRNTRSAERDKLDETLVPADSRLGVRDLRDKELRSAFNRVLDRGSLLTVILDTCHSGSGARGLPGGLKRRGVTPDLRDVADGSTSPAPEDRGALILSATEDFDQAYEIRDPGNTIRGAFTWALARAMRDADPGETASDTFLRARAQLRADVPAQDPVLAGDAAARRRPLLEGRAEVRRRPPAAAIEALTSRDTYVVQSGWANGITVGSELRSRDCPEVRLEVTSLIGMERSEARLTEDSLRPRSPLSAGSLLEVSRWAAPPVKALRVWMPRGSDDALATALALQHDAAERGIRWLHDPTEETPTHLVRWNEGTAELLASGGARKGLPLTAGSIPRGAALFVQLPVPPPVAKAIGAVDGVELTSRPEWAEYVLVGRLRGSRVEYAWIRPFSSAGDRERSALPARTSWVHAVDIDLTDVLRGSLYRLRQIHGWRELNSPPGQRFPYQLAIRHARDGVLVQNGLLKGDEQFRLVLRARATVSERALFLRYLYVFVIDSYGRSVVLFPRSEKGSVENRLPLTATASQPVRDPPGEIALGDGALFTISPPYGVDTYFLLSTDEPLSTPAVLEWDAVRGSSTSPRTPLEQLLSSAISGTRGADEPLRTPPHWSIEQVPFVSVPPRRTP
jgi:hypothetical protein